jgi:penicillin amidase
MEPDAAGATIFEVFFSHWTRAVARARFDEQHAAFVAGAVNGLAAALLHEDTAGWFDPGQREPFIRAALQASLSWLTDRLGPDMSQWTWGRLHTLTLRHILSGRGDLGQLLDHGGVPVPGNMHTVCNTGLGAQFESRTGAGFRLIADLSTAPPELLTIDAQGQSGQPGSPHYSDQLDDWVAGSYHKIIL